MIVIIIKNHHKHKKLKLPTSFGNSWRWNITPLSSCVVCAYWLPSKEYIKEREEKKVTLWWRILTDTNSAKWSRSTSVISHTDSMHPWYGVMKWHSTSVLFFWKTHHPRLIVRKTSEKPQLRFSEKPQIEKPPKNWLVHLKIVKLFKKQGKYAKLSQSRGA